MKLLFFIPWEGGNAGGILNHTIDSFNEKYPYIKINHQPKGGYKNLNSFLKVAVEKEERLPTMAFCYPYQVLDYQDKVQDMSIYVNQLNQEEINDFIPGFFNEGYSYSKEGYYSLPFFKSTYNLYYNLDFFEKENLKVPSTWSELWTTCRQIKAKNKDIIPFAFESSSVLFTTMYAQREIPYISLKNGEESIDYNNEKANELLIELKEYHEEGLLYTQNTLNREEGVSDLFVDSKIAMVVASTGGTSYYVNRELEFVTAVAPLPQTDLSNHKQPFFGRLYAFLKIETFLKNKQKRHCCSIDI